MNEWMVGWMSDYCTDPDESCDADDDIINEKTYYF